MELEARKLSQANGSSLLSKLTSEDLQTLRLAFEDVTKNANTQLSKREFSDLMKTYLGLGSADDYDEIFDLVDVTREGVITWDMLSNHLMLQYYEQDDRTKHAKIPTWSPSKQVPLPHKSFICKTLLVNGKYYTIGRDGLLCVLDSNFHLKNSYQIITNPDEIRAKDLWVTDACYLSNVNKVAFSTTSREILIYEVQNNKKNFTLCYRLHGFKFIPMCLDFWVNPDNALQSVLSAGDTGGTLHAFFFTVTGNNALFETLNDSLLQSENGQKICQNINISSLSKSPSSNVQYLSHSEHSSWIRQVGYFSTLDCFMTCSTNAKESLTIAWVGKGRRSFRIAKFAIGLGLSSFDYHEKLNIIATGGIDNLICLWNPYVTAKPNGVLRGHVQTILNLKYMKDKNLLLSVSKDKILRVWDVQLQMCLQRLTGLFALNKTSVDFNFQMVFDNDALTLISAINSNLYTMRMKNELQNKILTHDASVTNLIFNENFNQVITVCEASTIVIWYLNTGQKIKSINNAHNSNEITALSLDHSKTHILTGGADGLIKVWDMNGSCHNVLVCANHEPCEITQILCSKRSIFAVGWSKNICVFSVSEMKSYYVQPTPWGGKQKHYDDVFAILAHESKYLISASYDGDVVYWNINSHNSIRKIFTSGQKLKPKALILPPIVSKSPRNSIPNVDFKRLSIPGNTLRRTSIPETIKLPNTDGNEDNARNDAVTISSVCLLASRDPTDEHVSNLFVTHTDGSISFWNTQTCKKLAIYHVFDFNGSIVSCVNLQETVAGLGSETGVVKLIDIDRISSNNNYNIEVEYPMKDDKFHGEGFSPNETMYRRFSDKHSCVISSLFHHTDVITSIRMVDKLNVLFILTSSADCTVSLHCNDQLVGVFGSEAHWNLNDFVDGMKKDSELITNSSDEIMVTVETTTNEYSHENPTCEIEVNVVKPVEIADVMFDQLILSDTWQNTMLGKAYQLKGKRKRKISRASTNSNHDRFMTSYERLPTNEMSAVSSIEKPDFVIHPEKYFLKREDIDPSNIQATSDGTETRNLKFVHDEKNFFPKHILDIEMKRRAVTNITTYSNPRSKVSFKTTNIKASGRQSERKTR